MYFYPGGSMYNNPSSPNYDSTLNSYSHFMNFFSDLGLYNSWSGEPNFLSNILFSYSLLFVGIGIVSFYSGISWVEENSKPRKRDDVEVALQENDHTTGQFAYPLSHDAMTVKSIGAL